ncbi:hypothetical protein V502_10808 [Pseudogymnoascus sp. VKM F-4520 (FW-2644)]|nr:hypothetical protein V502_10808 [Pseudogymnoascus sp. VKM F-4520 (FW-2644)]
MRLPNAVSLALGFLLAESALADYHPCVLIGPDVPIPRAVSSTSAFKDGIVSIKKAIADAISTGGTSYGDMDASATSFSLQIYSVHEEEPLFTYHYDAPGLANSTDGVKKIDSDSIYRLASVSKVLTVYTFLAAVGDVSFNEPITKYIPELAEYAAQHAGADEIDFINWDSVTVGSLISQLSGIPPQLAGSPDTDALHKAGFPPGVPVPVYEPLPENITDTECPNLYGVPCDRAGVLGSINFQHPALAPSWGPAYSNMAFSLLAYALEDMTNSSLSDLLTSEVIDPLGLKSTYYANAPLDQGVVPYSANVSQYTVDILTGAPTGGFYSSTNDMRKIGKAILNSTLLSPAQTNRWLKPLTFTANDGTLVGAPWEIYKAPLPERSVWMYTKGGDLAVYSTQIALLPDFGIGFTYLGAGDDPRAVKAVITDIVAAVGVPAFEKAAKEEAANVYAGTYQREGSSDTFVIAVDANPGLLVTKFLINGTDVVAGFAAAGDQIRLTPSGLVSKGGARIGLRGVLARKPVPEGAFVSNCVDWFGVGQTPIGGVSLDEFVVKVSEDGTRAVEVEPRGWRVAYSRV